MPSKILVDVLKLNGETLTLSVERQTTVLLLKHKLSELWNVPPECQKLIHGGEVLHNGRCLTKLHKNKGASLTVACIISAEEVFACLENASSSLTQRQSSMRALADMAHLDYERAVQFLRANLEHEDYRAREVAMHGLIKISQSGNSDAVPLVWNIAREGLNHPDEMVRAASVELAGLVAQRGDTEMLRALCGTARDPSHCVKTCLPAALSQVAEVGDSCALEVYLRLSVDPDCIVREAAARALGDILQLKSADVAKIAIDRLAKDKSRMVRDVAAQALSNMQVGIA